MIPSSTAALDASQLEALRTALQEDLEGLKSLAALGQEQARELLWRSGHGFGAVVSNAMLENHATTARRLFDAGATLGALDLSATQVSGSGLRHLAGLRARSLTLPRSVCTSAAGYPLSRKPRTTKGALKHLADLEGLEHLELRAVWLDDDDAPDLARLGSLRELELGSAPVSDASLSALSGLLHLERLELESAAITATGLAYLRKLSGLRSLRLGKLEAGEAALAGLAELPALQALDLRSMPISDVGLAQLRGLRGLRSLRLGGGVAGPDGPASGLAQLRDLPLESLELGPGYPLAACAPFQTLRCLSVLHQALSLENVGVVLQLPHLESLAMQVSEESQGLGALGSLEKLWELRLEGFGELPPEDAAELAQLALRRLALDLSGVSEASCEALARCASLRELKIASPRLSDPGVGHLSRQGALTELELRGPLRDPSLAHLSRLAALEVLRLAGSGGANPSFSSSGLSSLLELRQLRELGLHQAGITDEALATLAQLRGLRRLELFSNPCGARASERLQAQLPECQVAHTSLGR